jgi:glycerate 2-kinase
MPKLPHTIDPPQTEGIPQQSAAVTNSAKCSSSALLRWRRNICRKVLTAARKRYNRAIVSVAIDRRGTREVREPLRNDALAIWQAAVDAVRSDRLVESEVRAHDKRLHIGKTELPLDQIRRIVVVGAGKAGAGMAAGLEAALGPQLLAEKHVTGWVNVPADCVRQLAAIHLHPARPAGLNEPTADGVRGSEHILELVAGLGPDDLCICLISGGGSALLPAPSPGISLAAKQQLTRDLSAAGANIEELNTVRKQISRIKGGGLARACRAGHLITLVISDVLGDPLDVIASGPTVPNPKSAADALAILERLQVAAPPGVRQVLEGQRAAPPSAAPLCRVANFVIGNLARAVDAAGAEAVRRGYAPRTHTATTLEGPAEEIGKQLTAEAVQIAGRQTPYNCLITGGEPTVRLAPADIRGKGGRNQQLVLAAMVELLTSPLATNRVSFAILSGGTDGEDGPTDAAGGVVDRELLERLTASGLDPTDYLRRNDAYTLLDRLGGLVRTGPTHTNVCDVRVVIANPTK